MTATKTPKASKSAKPAELPLRSGVRAVTDQQRGIALHSVELMPDANEALVAGFAGVWTLDLATGNEVRRWQGDTGRVCWAARVTRDGARVVAGFGDLSLKSWDARTKALLFTAQIEAGIPTRIALSRDGTRAATAATTDLRVWDLATGQAIAFASSKKSFANACALTPDGKLAMRGGTDGVVRALDVATGEEAWASPGHGWIEFMDASGDGRTVAVGGRGKAVALLETTTGERVRKIDVGANIGVVALSADGRFVAATTGGKRPPTVWDLEGRVVGVLAGHTGPVESVRFAHDSATVASADIQGNVRVFELPPP